jgi:mono/diheme cytochrome c family protein
MQKRTLSRSGALWRLCILAPLASLTLTTLAAPPPPKAGLRAAASPFDTSVRPFVARYCVSCHQGAAASAGLNLTPFLTPTSLDKDSEIWRHIVLKVRTGQMPPSGSPHADAATANRVTAWIAGELDRRERAIRPEAGRVTARRLNRAEYNNTVRDLLGVDSQPADDFPQDDSGYGFDNIGDVLSLSPPLLERYLATAEKVARTAIFGPEKLKPRLVELHTPHSAAPAPAAIPAVYDQAGLTLPSSVHASYRFPVDGNYLFQVVLTGLRPPTADPLHIALWIDGKKVEEKSYAPVGSASFPGAPIELYGQTVEFGKHPVTEGDHSVAFSIERYYEGLPASMGGPNPSKQPEPPARPFRFQPPKDATPAQLAEFKDRQAKFQEFQDKQKRELPNAARLNVIQIGGPYDQRTAPSYRSRVLLYTCGHLDGHHGPGCARKILGDLARRAFRRPVSPQEVAPYLRLVTMAQHQGDSFDEGLSVAVQAMLVSPHFLYRIERDAPAPAGGSAPINDYELASRLSYFLWSSMPDAELMRCADAHTLRQPATLRAQVARMLRDPKADALVENFAGQWLELRKLESVKPNQEKFTAYDEYLRLSMRRETELFFQEIVQKDRPVLDFLDADYTFLNQRLAQFYGIPGVTGPEFRRVSLAGTNRGGVLTQASVLTVTSYATRTSPVLRGKWILENLLNAPPPAPPPGVPALEETKVADGASLRQQLEEHRKKPLCASCHARMDPLGFGLENFDAIGAWRTVDGKTPIEPSGTLPNGKSFSGPQQLKTILLQDRDAFTRCLTTKLLIYALGRGLERYDQPTVRQIAAGVAANDYRFSSLVLGIVTSLPFQQRKGTASREPHYAQASFAPHRPEGHRRGDQPAVSRRDGAGPSTDIAANLARR